MNYNDEIKKIENSLFEIKEDKMKSQLYGYFSSLILSKKYAKNNPDLVTVMGKFGFEFKPYVYKSRTVLLSRVIRIIEKKQEKDLLSILDKLFNYITLEEEKIDIEKSKSDFDTDKEEKKKKKKKNIFDDIFNQLG